MNTVESRDGTTIAYETHGSGPPVLCLSGGGGRHFWDPLLDGLTDDCRVYCSDRRGQGDSSDQDTYSIEREIEDACAMIDEIDGTPALIGHSFGGLQAIEAARRRPVRSIVVYEPAYLVGTYREQASLSETMQHHLDAGRPRAAVKAHYLETIHGGSCDDFDGWLAEWPGWPPAPGTAELYCRMDRALESFELDESIDLAAPTLVCIGSDGPAHLRESSRVLAARLDDSQLLEFEGVGHMGPVTTPRRFLNASRRHITASQ